MNLQRLFALIRKEFIHIRRDPRTVMLVLIQPLIFLALYGFGISFDIHRIPTAVYDQDRSQASAELLQRFWAGGYFTPAVMCDSPESLRLALDRRHARLAVVIPPRYAEDLNKGLVVPVQLVVDGSDSNSATLSLNYATAILRAESARLITERQARRGMAAPSGAAAAGGLEVESRYWYNPALRSANFIIPGLMGVVLMLVTAMTTTLAIVGERERGTMESLIVSPLTSWELMLGKMIPYYLMGVVNIAIVILAALFVFQVPLRGSPVTLVVMAVIYIFCPLAIGLWISTVAHTQAVAMNLSIISTNLPTFILSGFVFPLASMPLFLQVLSYLMPARYFVDATRGIFLKGVGWSILWPDAVAMALFAGGLLWLSVRRFRKGL